MPFESINPFNNELLKTYRYIEDDTLDAAISAAHAAFAKWRQTDFATRRNALNRFADLLEKNQDELARLITTEMGKRLAESLGEIRFCIEITKFYADNGQRFLADQSMPSDTHEAYLRFEPLGVILGVMPWNFPFYQIVRFATPNIMCGNTVVVKHATSVPQCAEAIEKLFHESGLGDGVYTNLFVSVDQVQDIIDDRRVKGVSLTGSERAGSAVAQRAGLRIKKSVLELGGNDPFIVLEDADLKKTVRSAVAGRMRNSGQSCVASKRFIVVESVAAEFIEAFGEKLAAIRVGDPLDTSTQMGPLSTEQAAQRLDQQVQSAIKAGATVVVGGDRPNRDGAFFNPTILTDVASDGPTYDVELFGPVATIHVVADEAAAIELANDSSFGLGGSVYTADLERGRRVAEQIETGMMFVNEPTRSQTRLPFGGIKNSGYGRELSHLAIEEFVNKKLIHLPRE